MKNKLKNIDWGKLNHAYGSAEDVPELLYMLQSNKKSDREEAIQQLYCNIYHQKTIYPATGYTIPFLIDIISDKDTEDKEAILGLLCSIAYGIYRKPVNVDVIDELRKGNQLWYNYLLNNTYLYKIYSIQILLQTTKNKDKLSRILESELKKTSNVDLTMHLILGLYLAQEKQVKINNLKLQFRSSEITSIKSLLACLIVNNSPNFKHHEEIQYLLNNYLEKDENLDDVFSFWSDVVGYMSKENVLISLSSSILKHYYSEIKNREAIVKRHTDNGGRMYEMTDYLCLLIKSVFEKRFSFNTYNDLQIEVIKQLKEFYKTTSDNLYNWWLDGELYDLCHFIKWNFEVDYSIEDLKKMIKKENGK